MNKLVFPCYYTSMFVRGTIKHIIWLWPNNYGCNYSFLIAGAYHKSFTKKVTVNDLSKFICLLQVKQPCWKNFQDYYYAKLHPNFLEETADQEEIGNSGIQLMVERWTYFVIECLQKSCIMMTGDIAILYILQYIDF